MLFFREKPAKSTLKNICIVFFQELINREKGDERKRSNDRPTHGAGPSSTRGVKSSPDP